MGGAQPKASMFLTSKAFLAFLSREFSVRSLAFSERKERSWSSIVLL